MTPHSPDRLETPDWDLAYAGAGGTGRAAFHALYRGDTSGNARRGLAAVLTEGPDDGTAARETAELAAHGFIEGYFGAAPTLSAPRAAGRALQAINAWLHGQSHNGQSYNSQSHGGRQAGFAALLLTGRRLGMATLGPETILRRRAGEILPLVSDPARPARTLGTTPEAALAYREEEAQPGDRYVLATSDLAGALPAAGLARALGAETPAACVRALQEAAPGAALLVIDLYRLPAPRLDDMAATLAELPLLPPPQEGETLDGFVIGRTLYRSRYTLLRRAVDTVERREVVLKFPLPAMLQDRVFQAGFAREAWIGGQVRSSWVAGALALPPGRQSALYIALPYYRGETLERRLARRPRIGFAEGLSIALRLAAAVGDLDRFQVVHRDLKPENVILPEAGGLRLLDLGLAYLPGFDDPEEERLGGTTRYMAPELFAGTAAGPRSEVFALGATIYRMFSGGAFGFSGGEVRPLSRLRPDLPLWLSRCIGQAVAVDPARRFADAAGFAAALETGLLHGDARAAGGSWRSRIDDLRLWRTLALLFAAAFLAALAYDWR
jgi:hypothetical protein